DYIKTIADNTENIAFRIDGKSYSTTSSRWIIGSLTNDTQEPQLVLEYDDPNITKTEVSVNIKNGSDVLKTYSDRIVGSGIYTISNDQTRYIRKGNDVYYFPMNGQTVYSVSGESADVDVEFDKITVSDLVFFEDFNVSAISDISGRGISATNAEISKGTLSISDSGTVTLPSVPAHTGALTVAFDFTASSIGSTFTFKSNTSDIISLEYSADTQRHTASVMLDGTTASISIDGVSANNSTGSTADAVTQIAVSGGAVIDNLRISAADLTYTGTIKNSSFAGGTDKWTVTGNAYASDDISNSSFIALKDTSSISQKLTGIESGKYDLHARVKNDNMGNIAYVYAKAKGHPIMKTSVSVTTYLNDGDWRDIYVKGITIDEAECEIGLVLSQLAEEEIMVDNRVTDEPMPDGKGTVFVKSFELTSSTEKTRDTFLAGGDINWLTFLEDKGVKYYDENGVEKDAVQVMAENGANIVRLRLYNDPGKGHGDSADYLPDGWQGPEDILRLARRAKEKGMQIQLTFHYRDYWTNANDQLIPHEWAEKVAELGDDASQDAKDTVVEQCLYDFTKDFMQKMHDQGTDPEYVSFGNEMHTGLLFDKNRATYDYGSTYRWSRLASLLKTAGRAAKEVYPDTKVILHLDGAGNWGKYNTFFSACKENEVPYDVIGISYYPYWYPEYDV
ncbi:MAG: glycosyl hydrolase 53 family protein, partial [Clostridia bacterium]|nr:glycosyl hydrolase 53 family protein [Clostridia bacterium]